jgi:hypothetical protein
VFMTFVLLVLWASNGFQKLGIGTVGLIALKCVLIGRGSQHLRTEAQENAPWPAPKRRRCATRSPKEPNSRLLLERMI